MDGSGGIGRTLSNQVNWIWMVAVALVGPSPIKLSANNLIQNLHTQEEEKKYFVNCMSEDADT